ncbi:YIP1 family protein [Halobacterium zhouii]|uniref:YIP1 family protein n=1 Tax=Halobacterium zhouii TaxID=2902624 RepID=UPI001E2872E5|nr:YIP1 family protein [Halobacterium zhouii]
MELRRALLRPDDYFATHTPSWTGAVGVVAASAAGIAFVTFVSALLLGFVFTDIGAAVSAGRMNGIALTASFAAFLVTFILWVLVASALHLVVMVTNQGRADTLEETFGVAAWGFPPTVVTTTIAFAVVLGALLVDSNATTGQTLVALQNPVLGSGGVIVIGLDVVAACWQTYVWGYGLHGRHNSPFRGALVGSFVVAFTLVALSMV